MRYRMSSSPRDAGLPAGRSGGGDRAGHATGAHRAGDRSGADPRGRERGGRRAIQPGPARSGPGAEPWIGGWARLRLHRLLLSLRRSALPGRDVSRAQGARARTRSSSWWVAGRMRKPRARRRPPGRGVFTGRVPFARVSDYYSAHRRLRLPAAPHAPHRARDAPQAAGSHGGGDPGPRQRCRRSGRADRARCHRDALPGRRPTRASGPGGARSAATPSSVPGSAETAGSTCARSARGSGSCPRTWTSTGSSRPGPARPSPGDVGAPPRPGAQLGVPEPTATGVRRLHSRAHAPGSSPL